MSQLLSLELNLWECTNLHSRDEVVDLVRLVSSLGLPPAEGAWTSDQLPRPITEVSEAFIRTHEFSSEAKLAQQPQMEWFFGLFRPDNPRGSATLSIQQLRTGTCHVVLLVDTWRYAEVGAPLEDYVRWWGELLEQIGNELYARIRPALAAIIATDLERSIDFWSAVQRRRLILGWRTWFGAPYVAAFGREWLLNLPDRATLLEDGGVFHRLAAPVSLLVQSDGSAYASVRTFLEHQGVQSAWPPARKSRTRGKWQANVDADLTKFRTELANLLQTTLVLDDGQRVKPLYLEWDKLSDAHRRVALLLIREAVETELSAYPDALVHLEFLGCSPLPAEISDLCDALMLSHPRCSSALVTET